MEVIAETAGLVQGYRGRVVIRGLDLRIGPGRLGLLGPNGAGKTTLIRTLATVVPPRAGSLAICGERVDSERAARNARRNIGYLPQDFGYYPRFSIYDFVRYCAWLREVPGALAHEETTRAIAAVGLADRARDRLGSLSGGLVRRAGIATALVGQPRLLLLDEPTAGLDPAQRVDFRELLRSLPDVAVVLSTHLVEDVAAACDSVAVMNEGHLVFTGTSGALQAAASPRARGSSGFERGYMTLLDERMAAR